MLIIGISGKAGSGFDTDIAEYLKRRGFLIVSADDCVDDAWQLASVRSTVAEAFGRSIFENVEDPDPRKWERKRGVLGAIVKDDPEAQEKLNQILQPFIMLAAFERFRSAQSDRPNATAFLAPRLAHFFHVICHITIFIDREDANRAREVVRFYEARGFSDKKYVQEKIDQTLATQRDVKLPTEFGYDFIIKHPEDRQQLVSLLDEVIGSVLSTRYTRESIPSGAPLVLRAQSMGGQFVRAALSLAEISGIPVTFRERSSAIQKALHLGELCALCASVFKGQISLASSLNELTYSPGRACPRGEATVSAPAANSVSPILQLLLPALFARKEGVQLRIRGQTELSRSAPADYFARVFFPLLARTGVRVGFNIEARGFSGGPPGEISIVIPPGEMLKAADFTKRGELKRADVYVYSNGLEPPAVTAIYNQIQHQLKIGSIPIYVHGGQFNRGGPPALSLSLVIQAENSLLGVDAATEGSCGDLEAREAIERLCIGARQLTESTAAVDPFFADQVLVYLAHAGGRVSVPIGLNDEHIFSQVRLLNSFEADLVQVHATSDSIILEVNRLST